MEKSPSTKKQYELNVFYKRCEQLSRNIYTLPKDIKLRIFRMAIDAHMIEWYKAHKITSRSWNGVTTRYINGVLNPYSWLDVINGWGVQAPKNRFFPYMYHHTPGRWGEVRFGVIENNPSLLRGSIPYKYQIDREFSILKIKPCYPNNVIKITIDGNKMLDGKKIDILYLYPSDMTNFNRVVDSGPDMLREICEISERGVKGIKYGHWVHKKCRCLTCDLIRLYSHSQHGGLVNVESYKMNIKNKYTRIDHLYAGDSQWKTHTESYVDFTRKDKRLLVKWKRRGNTGGRVIDWRNNL